MRKAIGVALGIVVGAVGADALIRRNESVVGRLVYSRRTESTGPTDMENVGLARADDANALLHEGCREEVLAAARALHDQGHAHFSPADVIECMQSRGTSYADSTIRTHVVSRMCADAPDNHGTTYDDLERVERGRYWLRRHAKL